MKNFVHVHRFKNDVHVQSFSYTEVLNDGRYHSEFTDIIVKLSLS